MCKIYSRSTSKTLDQCAKFVQSQQYRQLEQCVRLLKFNNKLNNVWNSFEAKQKRH